VDLRLILQLTVFGLTDGAVVALSAAGFTLAYAVSRQINLAHGSVFALTTVVVATLASVLGVTADSPLPSRVLALLLLCVAGAFTGMLLNAGVERIAFRPFRGVKDPLGPLIASVALSFMLLQAAIWWHAAYYVAPANVHQGVGVPLLSMPNLIPAIDVGVGGVAVTLKDVIVLAISAVAALGGSALMTRTRLGRLLRAVQQDPEMTALCGGDPGRAQLLAFAVAGALAGFGAAIFAAYFGAANAQFGLRSGLSAMTAAVLGGVGNLGGALAGGMLIGVFSSFSDYLLDAAWTPLLVLALLILLLAFRPQGLLGSSQFTAMPDTQVTASSVSFSPKAPSNVRWVMIALLVTGLAFPWLDQLAGWYRVPAAANSLLLVMLAVGLSIVVGFAGLLDLGYAAFFAIGGYTAALLTSSGSQLALTLPEAARNPWLALPVAGLVAAGFGLIFGVPTIRTRGEYLAIVTLAFGEIVPGVIVHLPDWTGGNRGMSGVPVVQVGPWPAGSAIGAYFVALLLLVLVTFSAARLSASRIGRSWAAVREDDTAAASVGVDPPHAKLLAFAIGAGCAGMAGSLFAGLFGHVEPDQFDFTISLMALAAVVIGGRWGLAGAVLGGLTVAAYQYVLVDWLSGAIRALGSLLGQPALISADLRMHNFAVFGVALLLATLTSTRSPDTPSARARSAAARAPRPRARFGRSPARSRGWPRSTPSARSAPPAAPPRPSD
jgi:branched-chain amino acid transport system permease protein